VIHEDEVLGKAYDARLMRRLLTYLRPYRMQVVLAVAAIIAHSVLELAPPYLTKLVIDEYIPARDLPSLSVVAVLFLVTLAGSFAFEYLQTSTMQMIGQRIMFDLRVQILNRLQQLDVRFYDRNPVGRLMTRVTTDVDALNELFHFGLVSTGVQVVAGWIALRGRVVLRDRMAALEEENSRLKADNIQVEQLRLRLARLEAQLRIEQELAQERLVLGQAEDERL